MVSSAIAKSLVSVEWPSLMYSAVSDDHEHDASLASCCSPASDLSQAEHPPLTVLLVHKSTQFVFGETLALETIHDS